MGQCVLPVYLQEVEKEGCPESHQGQAEELEPTKVRARQAPQYYPQLLASGCRPPQSLRQEDGISRQAPEFAGHLELPVQVLLPFHIKLQIRRLRNWRSVRVCDAELHGIEVLQ